MDFKLQASIIALVPAALLAAVCSRDAAASDITVTESPSGYGYVVTQTNAVAGNEIVAFVRGADGSLLSASRLATGGTGIGGGGLTAQGSIAREGRWLFVANAGSNDITTFDLASGTPVNVSRVTSGGTTPVSVTAHGDLVYVLDQGGTGNIAGFRLDTRGELVAIDGSSQPLSGDSVTGTEVAFTPDGNSLVVTERDGNRIDVYSLDSKGRARPANSTPSDGAAPFGFGFTPFGELVTSEAAASAASAYAIGPHGRLVSLSASVANTQTAACWLVVDGEGRHAFTGNAGSGTVSSYDIGFGGRLSLASAIAGSTGAGSHTVDMAFGPEGKTFYVLANAAGTITWFGVDGAALAPGGSVGSLPASSSGLVAW